MATFLFDGDELKQCPYNINHRVLSRRLLNHMSKCSREPGAPELMICKYNSIHRIPAHEFNAHMVECPDNRQAIRDIMNPVAPRVPQTNNSQSNYPIIDGWETEDDKSYVLQGLEEKEMEEVTRNDGFISQHQLYGLKPAERKRIYNQRTEDVIRRKAQGEREELTDEQAAELGLTVERAKFKIDTEGERPSSTRDSDSQASGSRASDSRAADSQNAETYDARRKIKRPVDEDEEDNKEEVRKLIRAQGDCFKTRESRY